MMVVEMKKMGMWWLISTARQQVRFSFFWELQEKKGQSLESQQRA